MKTPFLTIITCITSLGLAGCDAQSVKQIEPSTPNQTSAGEKLPALAGIQLPAPKTPTEACVQAVWFTEAKGNIPAFVTSQTEFLDELETYPKRQRDDILAKNFQKVSQLVDGSTALVKTLSEGYTKISYDKVDADVAQAAKEYCDRSIAFATALSKYWNLKQKVVEAVLKGSPTAYAESKLQAIKAFDEAAEIVPAYMKSGQKFGEVSKPYVPK